MKEPLSFGPSEKIITFPMWRDERKHLYSIYWIVGHTMMWAIRQSSLAFDLDADKAAKALKEWLKQNQTWDNGGWAEFTCDEIYAMLEKAYQEIPEIMAWNEIKDKAFIGIGALARNVSHSMLLESLYEEDQKLKQEVK